VLDERFPVGLLDRFGEQVDLSERNSWGLLLGEVTVPELQEAMQINACAPFVITSRLRPLMERIYRPDKHIVFVSAMEGAFYRKNKTPRHPHTNMAVRHVKSFSFFSPRYGGESLCCLNLTKKQKAALNMIVRTSAQEFVKYGIHLNCVDTGWVTNEAAAPLAQLMEEKGFTNPLDCVDGAARVLDPIFSGMLQGSHRHGFFFKDYFPRR
jgi:NAD(P)-dependent dehydrogenase (short-subunit alcohol dehydrogenase family)